MSESIIVYQTETYNYTPAKIAEEFARYYFGEPRKVSPKWSGAKFHLVDGNATYEVRMVVDRGIDSYQIARLS